MTDVRLRLELVHLYPEEMGLYGDIGNVITLERRCQWRGIDLSVTTASIGEPRSLETADIVFMGGGQDSAQSRVAADLMTRAAGLRDHVESDGVLLAVCGGYQLLGNSFVTVAGEEIAGAGIFDVHTVPGEGRFVGDLVVRSTVDGPVGGGAGQLLVGFENHAGRTHLAPGATPFGEVLRGHGNAGDGSEGAVYRNAFGTYLHGSLLPKNPWFADELIRLALARRYGITEPLGALDDTLELRAAEAAITRCMAA